MELVEGTKQHDTFFAGARKGKNNRVFEGNTNYVRFFNKEVKEFFENKYVTHADSNGHFESSKMTHKGRVIYRKDQEFENVVGTLWTGNEKELFFNCLARYSIHEIDRITEVLKSKSQAEVLVYYEILRKELSRVKSRSKKRRKYGKIKLRKGDKEVICEQPSIFKKKGLMRYSEIPVSHEMSEEFIAMEEEQADLISKKERTKDNDENQRFKTLFDEYTDGGSKERSSSSPISELEDDSVVQLPVSSTTSGCQALINIENSQDLSKELYASNTITPLVHRKMFPKLHYKSTVLFEALTRLILTKLLAIIIENKTSLAWLRKRHINTENHNLTLNISQSDVYGALNVIRRQQFPDLLLNFSHSYKKFSPLQQYFNSIPEKLGICVQGDNSSSQHAACRSGFTGFEKENVSATDKCPHMGPFTFPDPLSNRKNIFNATGAPIPHVSSLFFRENKLSQLKSSHVNDELLQEMIFEEELKRLDSNEFKQSTLHEYLLLTYFCSELIGDDREKHVTKNKEPVIDNKEHAVAYNSNVINEMENDNSDSESFAVHPTASSVLVQDGTDSTVLNTGITENSFCASENIEVTEASSSSMTSLLDNFDYTFATYSDENDLL